MRDDRAWPFGRRLAGDGVRIVEVSGATGPFSIEIYAIVSDRSKLKQS